LKKHPLSNQNIIFPVFDVEARNIALKILKSCRAKVVPNENQHLFCLQAY
jgi:hypothetical protein